MTASEVLGPLRDWTVRGQRAGMATLVKVRRSAPRSPGARFAVSEEGELAGSVSSGCVEGDLHEHLLDVIRGGEPRTLHYGITDEMAMEVGLACGGEIDVLVEPFDPESPVWDALREVIEERGAAVLLQGLSEDVRTRAMLVRPDGTRAGSLGAEELDAWAAVETLGMLETGGTRILDREADDDRGAGGEEEGAVRVFAEAFLPPARLAIVGASPVAAALCRMAALTGDEVIVIDPREAFATPEKFPDAARIVHAWPEEGLEAAGLDRWLDVVVLAHDRKLDVPALAAALRADCRFVGQIGGGRTQRLRREALAEEGFGEEDLERIRGPVGLDIGAQGPEEIAVSILSEVVAVRRGSPLA